MFESKMKVSILLGLLFFGMSALAIGCGSNNGVPRVPLAVIKSCDDRARFSSGTGVTFEVSVTNITPADAGDQYFEGALLSLRQSSNGVLMAEHRFQSSYDIFRLDLIDLTLDGQPEHVLVTGIGRGTSVRAEWLEVLEVYDGAFRTVLKTPCSGFFGSGATWEYRRDYRDFGGQMELILTLHHTPLGERKAEVKEAIPPIDLKRFRFQTKR